jgi:hypothetical protein
MINRSDYVNVEWSNKFYDKDGQVIKEGFFLFLTNGQIIDLGSFEALKGFVEELYEIHYRIDKGFEKLD